MDHIKTFFIGIIFICIGIYFGDPVPKELSIDLNDIIQLTENIPCLDEESGGKGYCESDVPVKTGESIP